MTPIQYTNVHITDASTGEIVSIIPCTLCRQHEKGCPVYQDAMQYNGLLDIGVGQSPIGNKIITIGFPRSYGDVLRRKEIGRWQEIAKQCEHR